VVRGSLLVIPSGKALLYAEPIFLQSQTSAMPELRLVVLALQDKLAYGPTFQAALTSLYGGEAPTASAAGAPQDTSQTAQSSQKAAPATDQKALIAEAAKDFDDYQRLTAAGKLGEAGQKLDQLKGVLDKLNASAK
jgi:hypothetical protein